MNIQVIILYLVIQVVVQYMLYAPVKSWLFKLHSKHRSTIPYLKIEFVILNILISFFVFFFTGRGGVTGMTNTFASVILGIIMVIQYKRYCNDIISGKYYKDLARKEWIDKRAKEILEGKE